MNNGDEPQSSAPQRGIRWWPAAVIVMAAVVSVVAVRSNESLPFQQRNLGTMRNVAIGFVGLLVWWTFFSRAPKRLRLGVTTAVFIALVLGIGLFRIRGVSGDLIPILEPRWTKRSAPREIPMASRAELAAPRALASPGDFPQFLGPSRNGVLPGVHLETNWSAQPPVLLWRHTVGAAWSGFVVAGGRALTQEQAGDAESVTCYDVQTGALLWRHTDVGRYATAVGGEGPRATPTVVSNRVFTLGATGRLNCLDLTDGKPTWTRNVLDDGGGKVPDWGFASSPLIVDELVIVHAGVSAKRSLMTYRADDGRAAWTAGTTGASYASPIVATLAGTRQVLAFNDGSISAHDPANGVVLWERPWGNGNVVCASPVIVDEDHVVFSSGYGVGAELLKIGSSAGGKLTTERVWQSRRLKSKFAHIFARDGFLYGLDDGIFACVDLKDGSQRWKEGRYGHGQGLLIGENYLLMAENGELVLLRPTPEAANELARYRVFNGKTWNPIALAGDLLLVRNDQEAACLRLKLSR